MDLSRILNASRALMFGTVVGRLASLASLPILSRLYVPESFANLALFVSILTALGPLLTLRYSQALAVPRSDMVLANLAALCLCIGMTVTAVAGASLAVFSAYNSNDWGALGLILPLAVIVAALPAVLYEVLSGLAIRDRGYGLVARTQAGQAIVGSVAKIGFGLVGAGPLGLISGQVAGQFAGIGSLLKHYRTWLGTQRANISRRKMRLVAKMFWQFPALRLPSQFLLVVASQGPVMFVLWRYDANEAGQFAMALSLVTTAMSIIGTNLGRAFLGEAGEIYRRERHRLARYTLRVQFIFALVAAPIALIGYFVAEPVLRVVLGPNWELASRIAPVLIVYGVAQISSAPVIQIFTFLKRQGMFLLINLLRVIAVGGLFVFVHFNDFTIESFALYYAILMVLFYIFVALLVLASVASLRPPASDHLFTREAA